MILDGVEIIDFIDRIIIGTFLNLIFSQFRERCYDL